MSQESQSGERRAQPVAAWAGAGSAGGCTARTGGERRVEGSLVNTS